MICDPDERAMLDAQNAELGRLQAENKRLIECLMNERRRVEHMLATIRQLYDGIRSEQSNIEYRSGAYQQSPPTK